MGGKTRAFCLCLLFLAFLQEITAANDLTCIREINNGYFDLTPLADTDDYTILLDKDVNEQIALIFNICRYSHRPCRRKSVIAGIYTQYDKTDANKNNEECIQISATTTNDYVTYSLLDARNITVGVQVLMTNGDLVTTTSPTSDGTQWSLLTAEELVAQAETTTTFSIAMNLFCNPDAAEPTLISNVWNVANFTYIISYDTKHACPLITLDQVSQFVDDNKLIFTIAGCIIGLLIAFLGLKLFLPTLFIAGFVSGFFVTLFAFFSFVITTDSRESSKWILFVFAIILGSLFGFLTVKANKFGIFVIGCWLGTIISLLLYNAILYKIHTNPAELVLLITLGVLGLGGGLLALLFYKHVIIIATSLGGSYAFVRALSLVIGHFPNEIQVIKQIQLQDYDFSVEWQFYVYMNGVFLLTLFSICVQYKLKKHTEAKELDFDAEYFKKVDV